MGGEYGETDVLARDKGAKIVGVLVVWIKQKILDKLRSLRKVKRRKMRSWRSERGFAQSLVPRLS